MVALHRHVPLAAASVVILAVLAGWGLPAPAQSSASQQFQEARQQAWAAQNAGKVDEAIKAYEKELRLATLLGDTSDTTVADMNHLGQLYQSKGLYDKAEPLFQRGLKIREEKFGAGNLKVTPSLNFLGLLYLKTGQFDKAEPPLARALQIRQEQLPADDPAVAESLGNLAVLCQGMGQYARAERYYEQCLAICGNGKDELRRASSLSHLATLYRLMGRYQDAQKDFQKALGIRQDKLSAADPLVAETLHDLANLYQEMGDASAAEPLYQKALTIWNQNPGPNSPQVARCRSNMAWMYMSLSRYDQAEPLLLSSLKSLRANFGDNNAEAARCLCNLGWLYHAQGQYDQAERCYKQGLAIREARLDANHPDVALALTNLGLLYGSTQRWDEAADDMDRAHHILRRYMSQTLPLLSGFEQSIFRQERYDPSFHSALSLAVARSDDQRLVERSADWVLNGKAVIQQALAELTLRAGAGSDPKLLKAIRELTGVRQKLASLTYDPLANEKENQRTWDGLMEEEQTRARQISQALGEKMGADTWVDLNAVRQAVPEDAVLIEIAAYRPWDFRAKDPNKASLKERHYAAWVIPPKAKGQVRLIDLGSATRIESAVQAFRSAIAGAGGRDGTILAQGMKESEGLARQPLRQLADLILKPLAESIDGANHWIISPDGALWLVPWAALPVGAVRLNGNDPTLTDVRYAVEDHTLSYVVSGRDLLARKVSPAGAGGALVLADPDYDAAGPSQGTPPAAAARKEAILPHVPRLPGTRLEADAIKPNLVKYAGQATVETGAGALESVFKSKAGGHQVVVLSTHGYFLEEEGEQPRSPGQRGARSVEGLGKLPKNPLLRCGLLLAGVNNRNQFVAAGDEDGVLTGLEIIDTNLRGTDLVVLSACETGLGEVSIGEGVAGLRQVFQLAGARSVMATLWSVPDQDTFHLMKDFFSNLAAGKSKPEALREAQLAQIKYRRDQFHVAHPLLWAAHTLTGP